MTTTFDKITGMLTGVMLGDLLGSTVEGLTRQQVAEKHGRITRLLPGSSTTDDVQLTVTVTEALISSGLDMDAQAAAHVAAFEVNHSRWGGNTKRAVIKLAHGYHWSVTGELLGIGNGVVMKLAPVAVVLATTRNHVERRRVEQFAIDLTRMSHATRLAVAASLAHLHGLTYLLKIAPKDFRQDAFVKLVAAFAESARDRTPPDPMQFDDLVAKLSSLGQCSSEDLTGNGYVWNSLPFSYAHFLRNPSSVDALFEVVSQGDDADTNGGLVGSLLGALNGTAVFPATLVQQVDPRLLRQAVDLAERLVGRFGT